MTPITQTEDYLFRLKSLIEPSEVLEKHGFTTRLLTNEELLLKRRCSGCGKALSQLLRRTPKPKNSTPKLETVGGSLAAAVQSQLSIQDLLHTSYVQGENLAKVAEPKPTFHCKYHNGTLITKRWTCCSQVAGAEPCSGAYEHTPRTQKLDELSMQYQFHHTPAVPPKHNDIRVAAALDCEMGTAVSGDSELIRITLIDYFSNEILVDNLVDPDVPMQHLNTRYSGVSWPDLKNARRRGMCLNGKAGARRAIWRYVDAGTIIVGHGVSNDMRALRWIHAPVVDSLVIESSRVKSKELKSETETQVPENLQSTLKVPEGFGKHQSPHDESKAVNGSLLGPEKNKQKTVHLRRPGSLSLKTLAKSKLNREIQMNGKQGHDSLEDAIAARDLVHHSILSFDDWC